MKVYRYWARELADVDIDGRACRIPCYGHANTSLDDALANAAEVAERTTDAFRSGRPDGAYGYTDRAMREEIVEEIEQDGAVVAAITRNIYGSLVLNTTGTLFADIDYEPPSAADGLRSAFRKVFGKTNPSPDEAIVSQVHAFVDDTPGLGLRLYRTAGGFRCLVTSATYQPNANDALGILSAIGSDPLYIRLCKAQECFRARLSPKFWRCGGERPPCRYPFADDDEELAYRTWEEDYHRKADACATCAVIADFGETDVDPAVAPILEMHDRMTCAGDARLA